MQRIRNVVMLWMCGLGLGACANFSSYLPSLPSASSHVSGMPQQISAHGENTVVVDPSIHRWGAYDANGQLVKAGLASCGADWCKDTQASCRTQTGTFRIRSLGGADCKSPSFPLPTGGAPMPYCMYFNDTAALHGVSANKLGEANLSHGCVRMSVSDAAWLRYHFVTIGTPVVIKPY